jgi:hypothetical protein
MEDNIETIEFFREETFPSPSPQALSTPKAMHSTPTNESPEEGPSEISEMSIIRSSSFIHSFGGNGPENFIPSFNSEPVVVTTVLDKQILGPIETLVADTINEKLSDREREELTNCKAFQNFVAQLKGQQLETLLISDQQAPHNELKPNDSLSSEEPNNGNSGTALEPPPPSINISFRSIITWLSSFFISNNKVEDKDKGPQPQEDQGNVGEVSVVHERIYHFYAKLSKLVKLLKVVFKPMYVAAIVPLVLGVYFNKKYHK